MNETCEFDETSIVCQGCDRFEDCKTYSHKVDKLIAPSPMAEIKTILPAAMVEKYEGWEKQLSSEKLDINAIYKLSDVDRKKLDEIATKASALLEGFRNDRDTFIQKLAECFMEAEEIVLRDRTALLAWARTKLKLGLIFIDMIKRYYMKKALYVNKIKLFGLEKCHDLNSRLDNEYLTKQVHGGDEIYWIKESIRFIVNENIAHRKRFKSKTVRMRKHSIKLTRKDLDEIREMVSQIYSFAFDMMEFTRDLKIAN